MTTNRPTLIEVAARAGVSKSTASLALRGAPVSLDALERVREAASELGYVQDRAAAAMRGARSGTIGLIVFDLTNPFIAELSAGISERLEQDGALALLADTGDDVGRQRRVLARMREHRIDGLILCHAVGSAAGEIESLIQPGLPVVQALRHLPAFASDYSGAENGAGTFEAARHLIGLGHRRLAFVGETSRTSVQRDRHSGVERALAEAGLPPPMVVPAAPTIAGGFEAVSSLLARSDRPTALVCFNDVIAIGATQALARAGLEPGCDLSVIGFDDIVEAALRSPALTSVAIAPREIGRQAAELILERLRQPKGPPRAILQAARLIIRETTGAPKARS